MLLKVVFRTRSSGILLIGLGLAMSVLAQMDQPAVRGVVRDPNGDPLPQAIVFLRTSSGDSAQISAKVDGRGAFSVDALPDGDYEIEATHPGFLSVVYRPVRIVFPLRSRFDFQLPISVVGGDAIEVSSNLVGRLRSEQMSVDGIRICLTKSGGGAPYCTVSNRLGQYFVEVPPGVYSVVLKFARGEQRLEVDLTMVGAHRDVIRLEGR